MKEQGIVWVPVDSDKVGVAETMFIGSLKVTVNVAAPEASV